MTDRTVPRSLATPDQGNPMTAEDRHDELVALLSKISEESVTASNVLADVLDLLRERLPEPEGVNESIPIRERPPGRDLDEALADAEAERDGWKAKHAALRKDVAHEEASRHYGPLAAILDRDDARDPQADPGTVTLRRDDVEALLSQWEDRGYHETDEGVDPLYSRVRAALGWGDEA